MRIFETGAKINFVDTNDVFIGFDAYQSCCESFGHFFTDKVGGDHPTLYKQFGAWDKDYPTEQPSNLAALVFDPTFYLNEHDSDGGGYAVFKLVDKPADRAHPNDAKTVVYLVLYNHHNGYYGHGFTVKHGGTVIEANGEFVRYEGGEEIRSGGL